MGAQFYFDKMLPTTIHETDLKNPKRQVEIFTFSQKLFLRIGAPNEENSGEERYTVELSSTNARELLSGLRNAMDYFGFEQ